jgi:hypothetical protein
MGDWGFQVGILVSWVITVITGLPRFFIFTDYWDFSQESVGIRVIKICRARLCLYE